MKHKHYDCIVAWASGKTIEVSNNGNDWFIPDHPFWADSLMYRIKEEPVVTVKYFQKAIYRSDDYIVPAYIEFTPDLEKWDLKITYHDDVAVKVELPNGDRND